MEKGIFCSEFEVKYMYINCFWVEPGFGVPVAAHIRWCNFVPTPGAPAEP